MSTLTWRDPADIKSNSGITRSKVIWFVTSSFAPHMGDIEARMGKPRC